MRKKVVMIFLAAALGAATLLSGCGNRASETSATSEGSSLQEKDREFKTREILSWIDYDPSDYVTLPDDYMKINVKLYQDDYKVTDEKVNEYIEKNILLYYPSYHAEDKEKTEVKKGDTVNIDYVGKVDGKEFEGGSAEGTNLEIGSGSFIDGFEDGLIGKKVGEKVSLKLKFPEKYENNPKLAGKDVVFDVTVNYITKEKKIKSADKINDAYVKENMSSMGMTTKDGLIEYVRSNLESQADSQRSSEISQQILDYLDKNSEVKVPDELVKDRVDKSMKEIEDVAKEHLEQQEAAAAESSAQTEESKKDLEEAKKDPVEHYLKESYNMTTEEYKKQMEKDLPDMIKQDLILQTIIKDQKVTFQGSEYNTWIQNIMSQYYMTDLQAFYDNFKAYGGKDYLMMQYAESQALQKVSESANIKEMLGENPDNPSEEDANFDVDEEGNVVVDKDAEEAGAEDEIVVEEGENADADAQAEEEKK